MRLYLLVREVRALAISGHGVLFTTHDPNQALRLADRAYLLRNGERIAEGKADAVLKPTNLEALYDAPIRMLTDRATGQCGFLPA